VRTESQPGQIKKRGGRRLGISRSFARGSAPAGAQRATAWAWEMADFYIDFAHAAIDVAPTWCGSGPHLARVEVYRGGRSSTASAIIHFQNDTVEVFPSEDLHASASRMRRRGRLPRCAHRRRPPRIPPSRNSERPGATCAFRDRRWATVRLHSARSRPWSPRAHGGRLLARGAWRNGSSRDRSLSRLRTRIRSRRDRDDPVGITHVGASRCFGPKSIRLLPRHARCSGT